MKINKEVIVTGLLLISVSLAGCSSSDAPTATVLVPTATTAASEASTPTIGSTDTPEPAMQSPVEATATQETAAEATPTDVALGASTTPASGTSATTAASVTSESANPKIVAAANAFLATLSDTEKGTTLFDWTNTAQKQRWSNFPPAGFKRAGLMWGNMTATQQNAWLAVMQATLSTEGYNRVIAEWNADEALLQQEGTGGGFGKNNYYIALIGTPSETTPWQWQWGGHHVTVNATIVGSNISLTPSFIGAQPATYTDANGNTVRPLGDIQDEALALVSSLDATQQKAAILGSSPIDLVLGPGQDGKTIPSEGLSASQMSADQQAALLKLIGHYAGLVNDQAVAARMAEIKSTLDQTYFAWYGRRPQAVLPTSASQVQPW